MNYRALYLSPMIPSYELAGTGQFFVEVLGFAYEMNTAEYVILSKDGHTVHIQRAGTAIGQMSVYLEITEGLDALWQSIQPHVHELHVRPPFDQPYGMREMHIAVPHTNTLLFIGQEIR